MGDPKFPRKKYDTPSHPWQGERIQAENAISKKYGLKNKREIWKAQTFLRNARGQARTLLAKAGTANPQVEKEGVQLIKKLTRIGLLMEGATLDDILTLETESVLGRRLQTLVYLQGLTSTPEQARQFINHGHIAVTGKKITVPGYLVPRDEESEVDYTPDSCMNDEGHPVRPKSKFEREAAPATKITSKKEAA